MGVFTNRESMERIVYAIFHHLNNQWKMKPFELFTQKVVALPISFLKKIGGLFFLIIV